MFSLNKVSKVAKPVFYIYTYLIWTVSLELYGYVMCYVMWYVMCYVMSYVMWYVMCYVMFYVMCSQNGSLQVRKGLLEIKPLI